MAAAGREIFISSARHTDCGFSPGCQYDASQKEHVQQGASCPFTLIQLGNMDSSTQEKTTYEGGI